jgi:DNA-binding NtrC family response regulator
MLTGHASVESGIEGMRLGAFDYLMKPCNIDDLVLKIEDAYQRKLVQEASVQSGL